MTKHHFFDMDNPELQIDEPNAFGLEVSAAISDPKSGNKDTRFSTMYFRTDNTGGYPMTISVRKTDDAEWHTVYDIGEIRVRISGDYEAHTLKNFLMRAGMMLLTIHGSSYFGDDDALREQTPSV